MKHPVIKWLDDNLFYVVLIVAMTIYLHILLPSTVAFPLICAFGFALGYSKRKGWIK